MDKWNDGQTKGQTLILYLAKGGATKLEFKIWVKYLSVLL